MQQVDALVGAGLAWVNTLTYLTGTSQSDPLRVQTKNNLLAILMVTPIGMYYETEVQIIQ